jgi:ornithine cyclodeaminase/alanine dehydrogenase
MLVVDDRTVRSVIDMDRVIALMEETFGRFDELSELPKRELALRADDADQRASAFVMAASTPAAACVKILLDITESATDPALTASQRSFISVIDPQSAELVAICEGRTITAYRTAAVSAVATKALARPDSKVLGLIGAGNLARLHAAAISSLFELDEIVVWSRTAATRERFAKETEVAVPIRVVTSASECAERADIICTLTPAREPIVSHEWIRDGTHINAVGSPPRPEYRELTSELVARARLVVDTWTAALTEAGDVVVPIAEGRITEDHIVGDLGDVIGGRVEGRRAESEITLFKSVGLALEDAVTARWIVDQVLASTVAR